MQGQRLARVKRSLRKNAGGVGNRQRHRADACLGRIKPRKLGAELAELLAQLRLGAAQVAPDLFAALQLGLTQRTHVAGDQRFHQLFDLVAAQVAAQQRDAFALLAFFEPHKSQHHEDDQRKNVHAVFFYREGEVLQRPELLPCVGSRLRQPRSRHFNGHHFHHQVAPHQFKEAVIKRVGRDGFAAHPHHRIAAGTERQ